MTDWSAVPLGEIILGTTRNGIHKGPAYQGRGNPIVKMGEVYSSTVLGESSRDLLDVNDRELQALSLHDGDLLFCRTSLVREGVGRCAIVVGLRTATVFASNLIRIRPDVSRVNPSWLAYYFRSTRAHGQLMEIARGTSVTTITGPDLAAIQIPLPSLDEQRRIAGVLGALDDLIEVNRALVRDLEALANSRFHQVIGASGVDAETCSLTSTVEILSGGTPKTGESTFWNGEIPWFSVADIPSESQAWVLSTEKSITEQGLNGSAAKLIPIGSTVLTARGTVGKTALVGAPMTINQSCYALICRAGGKGYFNLYRVRAAVGSLQRMSHGSVFSTITRDTLDSVQVPSVSADVIRAFDAEVDPYFQQMRALLEENNELAVARDELLPLLMSGRVRVGEVVAA